MLHHAYDPKDNPKRMKIDATPILEDVDNLARIVYKELGPGYPENIYQEAFAHEARLNGWTVERERPVPIMYKGVSIGVGKADVILSKLEIPSIVVETKAIVSKLTPKDEQQLERYMRGLGLSTGILVNFGQGTSGLSIVHKISNLV